MNNDLIKRNLAIAYASSGLVRIIDGEKWIKISEVKQSLNDVPTVEPQKKIVPVCKAVFDEEQLKEMIDKKVAELLADNARPQDRWGKWVVSEIQCPNCLAYFLTDCYSKEELNECPNCGADMRKPNCVTCDHFGKCDGCEKGEEE